MDRSRKILVIGGHGRVALRALPLLAGAGHDVSALIRKPEYEADIRAAGATPIGTEMLSYDGEAWEHQLRDFDVVVWAAGNGGRAGSDQTYAIDRDAAIASIGAASRLERPPRYLMISFASSLSGSHDADDPLHHFAQAKRAADLHLRSSGLEHAILGPGPLHDDDAPGLRRIDPAAEDAGRTSRQLVARVVAHLAGCETLPEDRFIAFTDGDDPVDTLA